MINLNYNLNSPYAMNPINAINDTMAKMNDAAQKIANGDVDVVEQVLQNEKYSQEVQAISKVIDTENKTIGKFIDILV